MLILILFKLKLIFYSNSQHKYKYEMYNLNNRLNIFKNFISISNKSNHTQNKLIDEKPIESNRSMGRECHSVVRRHDKFSFEWTSTWVCVRYACKLCESRSAKVETKSISGPIWAQQPLMGMCETSITRGFLNKSRFHQIATFYWQSWFLLLHTLELVNSLIMLKPLKANFKYRQQSAF